MFQKKRDYFVFFLFEFADRCSFGGFLHYLLLIVAVNFLSLVDDAAVLSPQIIQKGNMK